MPKKAKGKQALVALLLTLAVEGILLLCMGWGGARGWIDVGRLLGPTLAAVAIPSALGALYLGLQQWSAVPAALLIGVGVQLIFAAAGYFAFGCVGFDESRWWLPVVGFAAALLSVLFLAKPKSGTKKRRTKRRTK